MMFFGRIRIRNTALIDGGMVWYLILAPALLYFFTLAQSATLNCYFCKFRKNVSKLFFWGLNFLFKFTVYLLEKLHGLIVNVCVSPQFTDSADGLSASHCYQEFYSPAKVDSSQKRTAIR